MSAKQIVTLWLVTLLSIMLLACDDPKPKYPGRPGDALGIGKVIECAIDKNACD